MLTKSEPNRLRWGISKMGCAELSLPEACRLAAEFNLSALELRALWGRLDLPACTAELDCTDPCAVEVLAQHHLQAVVAGSGFKLAENDSLTRTEFLTYCQWAESWRIPYVSVFGGGTWGQKLAKSDFAKARETISWWLAERKTRNWRIEMLLETHSAFSASAPCRELLDQLEPDSLGLIWNSHHTWRLGNESPLESWSHLAPWIRHVQFKDSVSSPSDGQPFTYVLPGEGEMPLAEFVTLLCQNHFSHIVSLEWERLWHPSLPPLRVALTHLQTQRWFSKEPPFIHI